MKTSSLLLLSTVANAATLWPRQFGLGSRFGNVVKLASVVDLTPEVQPAAKHVIQRFGPITLKGRGYSKDSGQQNFMFSIPQNAFCRDCTVLKGRVGLADLNAVPIVPKTGSGVYIHHILTYDTSKSSKPFVSNCLSLMGGFLGSKFIGSGEDNNNVPVWYTSQDGSLAGGFHIGRSDRFTMNADLVSMNSESSQVYITMELEYLTGQVGSDARETLLNIGSCGGGRLRTSTSGPTNTTSGQYTFKEDGKIILGKGHMHAGGDRMQMYINNRLVCESKATYGGTKGEMAINGMSVCPIIKVKSGDSLTFSAIYDASKHPIRHETGFGGGMPDVMGMFDIVFSN